MRVPKKLKVFLLVIGTFLGFLTVIFLLARQQILTPQVAGLMAVAVFGMYVGFGILILAYRIMNKLQ